MRKIELLTIHNILDVQEKYDVDEMTSLYMAEAITCKQMGF